MTDEDSLDRAIHEPVSLVPYDAAWPKSFEAERLRLLGLFSDFLAIEHIGSTAVQGLWAKPIIDISAAVPSMDAADALIPHLCHNGYVTSADFNASLGDRRWLMRHAQGRRTHHLHLVLSDGVDQVNTTRFRDALRADPRLAVEYAALKRSLAESLKSDRDAYTEAKGAFIGRVLAAYEQ